MYNTVKIRSFVKVVDEFPALTDLQPGTLVEITSAGVVKKHATAGGNVTPAMFVLENEFEGGGLKNNIVAGNKCQVWTPNRGDIVYALLADDQNVAIGDALESNGLGKLQKHTVENWGSNDAQQVNTVYSRPIVGIAEEAKNLTTLDGSNSSLPANTQYIKVRIV